MTLRIIGTGSAIPDKCVTNQDLAEIVDTNDQWISSRTGIRERHLVSGEENSVSLGIRSAQSALENAGVDPLEIQMILVATCSSGAYFPSVACQIQEGIGAKEAVAFDISAACSGFLFAMNTMHAYMQTGKYKKALIVGTETLSQIVDWSDRGTCVLFGDGAGACVVEASDVGLLDYVQKSDGSLKDVLTSYAGTLATPVMQQEKEIRPIQMDGQAVFKFAVKTVPACIQEVLDSAKVQGEDVKYYVLHQANQRIIQSVAKRLQLGEEKFPVNLNRRGNTSAASIPILLDELNRDGKLQKGDKIILSGFGAGLTWAAALLQW